VKAKQHYEVVATMSDQPVKAADAKARLNALNKDLYPRIEIPTSYTDDVFSFAISPDGLSVVYQATIDGKSQLWLWRDGKTRAIAGTENARQWALPFWSPDGSSIGFFAEQKLKTVPVQGGLARERAAVRHPRGGTWNDSGVIVFAEEAGPMYRVTADGNEPPAALPQTGSLQNNYPRFLPDGRRFIFWKVTGGSFTTSVGSLDSGDVATVPSGAGAALVSPDLWYFANAGQKFTIVPHVGLLHVQRFDSQAQALSGSAVPLGDTVGLSTRYPGLAALSASAKGSISYRTGATFGRQMVWLDRTGQQAGVLGHLDNLMPCCMRFSVDGGTVAFYRSTGAVGSMWMMKAATGEPFLFRESARELVFSPTGDELVLTKLTAPGYSLFQQPLLITEGHERLIVKAADSRFVRDVSSERQILYSRWGQSTNEDLLAIPLKGGEPIPVAAGPGDQTNGRYSPDSRWVVYQSDDVEGRFEIFVQPLPGSPDSRRRVSVNGGTIPQWSRDGREIYFLSATNQVMVAEVSVGAEIQVGTPRPLFQKPLRHGSTFEMAPDGKRLLVNTPVEDPAPIVLLPNGPRRPSP
jgi:Tol biopolymer transport system component